MSALSWLFFVIAFLPSAPMDAQDKPILVTSEHQKRSLRFNELENHVQKIYSDLHQLSLKYPQDVASYDWLKKRTLSIAAALLKCRLEAAVVHNNSTTTSGKKQDLSNLECDYAVLLEKLSKTQRKEENAYALAVCRNNTTEKRAADSSLKNLESLKSYVIGTNFDVVKTRLALTSEQSETQALEAQPLSKL